MGLLGVTVDSPHSGKADTTGSAGGSAHDIPRIPETVVEAMALSKYFMGMDNKPPHTITIRPDGGESSSDMSVGASLQTQDADAWGKRASFVSLLAVAAVVTKCAFPVRILTTAALFPVVTKSPWWNRMIKGFIKFLPPKMKQAMDQAKRSGRY